MRKFIILILAVLLPAGAGCRRHRQRQPATYKERATPHPPRLQGFRRSGVTDKL